MAKQNRVVADNIERVDPVVPMFRSEMLLVFAIGLGVGLAVVGLSYLLNQYVFSPVLCRDDGAAECANAENYALIVAMVVSGIAGLIALVQARIYRPLLVVLATAISLWSVNSITNSMPWYWQAIIVMLLFGLTYALFTWIARIRSFLLSLIVIVVLVILVRLVFML